MPLTEISPRQQQTANIQNSIPKPNPSKQIPRIATLTIIKKDASLGAQYPLNHTDTRHVDIGRDPLCDIRIALPVVSRTHARIDVTHDENECNCIWLTPLSTKQGTYLNNELLTPMVSVELHDNDELMIGGRVFLFNFEHGEDPHERSKRYSADQAAFKSPFKSPREVSTPISVRSKPHRTPLSSILSTSNKSNASSRRISFAANIEKVRHYTPGTKANDFVNTSQEEEEEKDAASPEAVQLDFESLAVREIEQHYEEEVIELGCGQEEQQNAEIVGDEMQVDENQMQIDEINQPEQASQETTSQEPAPASQIEVSYPPLPTPLKNETPRRYFTAELNFGREPEIVNEDTHEIVIPEEATAEAPQPIAATDYVYPKPPPTPNFLGEISFDTIFSPPLRSTKMPEMQSSSQLTKSTEQLEREKQQEMEDVFDFGTPASGRPQRNLLKQVLAVKTVPQEVKMPSPVVDDQMDIVNTPQQKVSRKRARQQSPEEMSKKLRTKSPSPSKDAMEVEPQLEEAQVDKMILSEEEKIAAPEEPKPEQTVTDDAEEVTFFTPRRTRRITRKSTQKKSAPVEQEEDTTTEPSSEQRRARRISRKSRKQLHVDEEREDFVEQQEEPDTPARAETPSMTPRRSARLQKKHSGEKIAEVEPVVAPSSTTRRRRRRAV